MSAEPQVRTLEIPLDIDVQLPAHARRSRLENAGFDMKKEIFKRVNHENCTVVFTQKMETESGGHSGPSGEGA